MDSHAPGTPDRVLHEVFGYPSFRPGQREVVGKLLAGENLLAVMPTGAGKSLCYQVPALIQDRLTVVISPLVALMDDQVAALKANGVAAGCIHSARPREDSAEDWRAVRRGEIKLLYMSPERLMTERMLAALEPLDPGLFVVDEAHCISKWGINFRPEYGALTALKARFPRATLAGFTATADRATQRDIAAKLFDGRGEVIVQGFDRPNLWMGVAPKTKWRDQLLGFLEARRGQSGIVYCLSRRLTEEVAELLRTAGIKALPYHAGLPPEQRKESQETFMAEEGVVMVATIAFGMGIDKPDIRFVFHLNLPGSMEAYYQEIGRAGRDGAAAEVFMVYGLDDLRLRRQFIEQDGEDEDHKRREHKRLESLLAYCEATQCRRALLLAYFGESAEPCGNCDLCQDPPKLRDGSAEARLLFSAVADTGERFGAQHLITLLLGKTSERIEQLGHDRLPAFGAGATQSKDFWSAFIRQAVAGGTLSIDIERYGGLRLTAQGRAVLEGESVFRYREEAVREQSSGSSRRGRAAPPELAEGDAALYARLKELRRELARERQVPAYVVFSDKTLQEMASRKPRNLAALAEVNGVGPKKLEVFGQAFLAVLTEEN